MYLLEYSPSKKKTHILPIENAVIMNRRHISTGNLIDYITIFYSKSYGECKAFGEEFMRSLTVEENRFNEQ